MVVYGKKKSHIESGFFFDKLHGYKKVGWAEEIGERVCSAKMSFNLWRWCLLSAQTLSLAASASMPSSPTRSIKLKMHCECQVIRTLSLFGLVTWWCRTLIQTPTVLLHDFELGCFTWVGNTFTVLPAWWFYVLEKFWGLISKCQRKVTRFGAFSGGHLFSSQKSGPF